MSYVLKEINEHVAFLTINRPDALNAMNPDVINELIMILLVLSYLLAQEIRPSLLVLISKRCKLWILKKRLFLLRQVKS